MPMVAWSPSTRTHSSVLLYLRFSGCLRLAINTYLPSFLPLIKWQRYDLRCGAFPTYVNVHRFTDDGIRGFDITHADVLVESRAGRSASEDTNLLIVFVNSIATTTYASFNHFNANKFAFDALLF